MIENEDKIFIECECIDRCAIFEIEYYKELDYYSLSVYSKTGYWKKRHNKLLYSITITKDQAQ